MQEDICQELCDTQAVRLTYESAKNYQLKILVGSDKIIYTTEVMQIMGVVSSMRWKCLELESECTNLNHGLDRSS